MSHGLTIVRTSGFLGVMMLLLAGCVTETVDQPKPRGLFTVEVDAGELQKAIAKFQGTWRPISGMFNGQQFTAADYTARQSIIRGTQWEWMLDGKTVSSASFRIEPRKTPGEIDYSDENGVVLKGIYRFDNGDLTTCFAGPDQNRPTDFNSLPGSGWMLQRNQKVNRRTEKDEPNP